MTLRLQDHWIWDFWFAQDDLDYHIYYLKAPRSISDPNQRHWHTSIGHAVSLDLKNWEILPDAFTSSSDEGDWDDFTTWTGSILEHDGVWYMFYTGSNRGENGLIQRIGLASSTNLINWQKYSGNPVLFPDPQWYELFDQEMWFEQTWRDPWVFRYDGNFHAFITARSNVGNKYSRGVIGHATSKDLFHWKVCAPVTNPGEFAFMEVPQLIKLDKCWYLLFSITHNMYSQARLARPGVRRQTGTHYLIADHPFGPFKYLSDTFIVGDEVGSLYSGKVIQNQAGEWVFMAFRMFGPENEFIGEITDPLPLRINEDGQLHVAS